jgi:hypothetical protein
MVDLGFVKEGNTVSVESTGVAVFGSKGYEG